MNKRISLTLLLTLIPVLYSTGCKSTDKKTEEGNAESSVELIEIKGQVFVVQQNRQNLKLGAVDIQVFDEHLFMNAAKNAPNGFAGAAVHGTGSAMLEYLLSRFNELLERASEQKKDSIYSGVSPVIKLLEQVVEALENRKNIIEASPNYTLSKAYWIRHVARRSQFEKTVFDKSEKADGVYDTATVQDFYQWCINSLFNDSVNDSSILPIQVAQSDADGKFSLDLPAGRKFVVLVKESRKLPEGNENYYWIVKVPVDRDRALLLSNTNMLNEERMNPLFFDNNFIQRMDSVNSQIGDGLAKLGVPPMNYFSDAVKIIESLGDLEKIVNREAAKRKELESLRDGSWGQQKESEERRDGNVTEDVFGGFNLPDAE